jgi:hypothetical protein
MRPLILLPSIALAIGIVSSAGAARADAIGDAADLSQYEIQDLATTARGGVFVTPIFLEGKGYLLELRPHSFRADDFQLLVQRADGSFESVEPSAPATVVGRILGQPGSRVGGSLQDGQLTAVIVREDGAIFGVQPLSSIDPTAASSAHIVYSNRDLITGPWKCGGDILEPAADDGAGFSDQGTGLKICDVGFDADVEFYNKNHGSVDETMHDIESVMAGVEAIYERDTQITYEVTTILVRTAEPDPYGSTDPGTLLSQFRGDWNSNHGPIRRDIAHLMTGKNLNGSVIGIAYLGVVCGSSGYGLSQSRFSSNFSFRVGLTAHEMGHNWNASHCDGITPCYIMCSTIGGCSGNVTKFDPTSITAIKNHKNSRNCLDDLLLPVALPFNETFPSTTLDKNKWSYNNGAVINGNASNEPSGPNSVNLNAAGANADQDDDLRTNFILMGGVTLARLSFYTEHVGVANGEQLIVDAWTSDLKWTEIETITSNGVDQNGFEFHSHVLPATSYHDDFRVRFRAAVNSTSDQWYVDDVSVVEDSCPAPQHYGQATPGTAGLVPTISSSGVASVGSNDYKLLGQSFYGAQHGYLFTGFSRQTVQADNGVWLNVLPPWIVFSFTFAGPPLPGSGTIEIPAPIPNDPGLAGVHFMNFFLGVDPGSATGFGGSDGLDTQICQ